MTPDDSPTHPTSLPIVLASGSPRRHSLLSEAGLRFEIRVSDVDETVADGIEPERAAVELALRKARTVASELAAGPSTADSVLVIGADTIVALNGPGGAELLGKPADETEAAAMLACLSGSRHRVVTGVAVVATSGGEWVAHERTWVRMRAITDDERAAYVASGEWRGKAGGYAIQENADAFVTGLEEGGFDNVVGLPVGLTLELLERARAASGRRPPGET